MPQRPRQGGRVTPGTTCDDESDIEQREELESEDDSEEEEDDELDDDEVPEKSWMILMMEVCLRHRTYLAMRKVRK